MSEKHIQHITKENLVLRQDYTTKSAITIAAGEEICIETTTPYTKPNLTGPIHIDGVKPGDTIAITIKKIDILNDGVLFFGSSHEPRWWVLSAYATEPISKKVDIQKNTVHFSPTIQFATDPMVGRISLMHKSIDCDTGDHGGNMDTKELQEGATLLLHDKRWCGTFLLGDVHAAMGDGEICGTGIEISANVTIQVDVLKNTQEHRPIISTDTSFITLASRKTHEEAYKQCILDMVQYIQTSQHISFEEANTLVSAVGNLKVSSVVSHIRTYRMVMPKKFLKRYEELLQKK